MPAFAATFYIDIPLSVRNLRNVLARDMGFALRKVQVKEFPHNVSAESAKASFFVSYS